MCPREKERNRRSAVACNGVNREPAAEPQPAAASRQCWRRRSDRRRHLLRHAAEEAGADYVGADEFVQKIQKEGWLEFDKVVATRATIKGPRRRMHAMLQ